MGKLTFGFKKSLVSVNLKMLSEHLKPGLRELYWSAISVYRELGNWKMNDEKLKVDLILSYSRII